MACNEVLRSVGLTLQTAQQDFERAQSSYDPNQIMQVLQWHPYHVDSLLAIAGGAPCTLIFPVMRMTVSAILLCLLHGS